MEWFKKIMKKLNWGKGQGRREPRIKIGSLHHISINLTSPVMKSGLPLGNISTSGALVVGTGEPDGLNKGKKVEGEVIIQERTFRFQGKIKRIKRDYMALFYTSVENWPEFRAKLNLYFQKELSAMKMIMVGPEKLKPQAEGDPLWFTGENCDLYLIKNGGDLVRFELSFFGHIFKGGKDRPLKYQWGLEGEEDQGTGLQDLALHFSQMLTATGGNKIPREIVENALELLEHIESLGDETKSRLATYLNQSI